MVATWTGQYFWPTASTISTETTAARASLQEKRAAKVPGVIPVTVRKSRTKCASSA